MNIDSNFLIQAVKGKVTNSNSFSIKGFSIDSRSLSEGQVFIALKGDSFDGHDFVSEAVRAKAMAVVVNKNSIVPKELKESSLMVIEVEDTLKAKVIAITGSNGKTTTKDFTVQVLNTKFKTQGSKKSLNNHIGVPLSILEACTEDECLVLEMGMNHLGEIKELMSIADPDVVLCTNVGKAHLGNFDSIDQIALAKSEIYSCARVDAIKVFNFDNKHTQKMFFKEKDEEKMSYSLVDHNSEIFFVSKSKGTNLKVSGKIAKVRGSLDLKIFGYQNVYNLMAAASLSLAVGMTPKEVWEGLKKCSTGWGRNQLLINDKNQQIIFDGYNANPDSFKSLLDNLKTGSYSEMIGIFGEMAELGEQSKALHYELGKQVGQGNFKAVWFYGEHSQSFFEGFTSVSSVPVVVSLDFEESIAQEIALKSTSKTLFVCKASRKMKIERMIKVLQALNFEDLT